MRIESRARKFGARDVVVILMGALVLAGAACSKEESGGRSETAASQGGGAVEETTTSEKTDAGAAVSEEEAELARAEVGPKEITNMLPADGKKPDPARPLPDDPPTGVEV